MHVCTLLQTDNHASTSPLSFLQAGCPSCRPTNSVKALKAKRMELCIWSTTSDLAPDGPVRPCAAHRWPGNRLSWAQLTSMERPCRNSNIRHWTGHVMILPRHLCCTLILSPLLNATKQVKSDLLIDLLHR